MNAESARRVMETTCPDTANQYLRFGWRLINQYVVEATAETPATVKYVLASMARLEDTRRVLSLTDTAQVNEHLEQGWKLIDKHVTTDDPQRRDEVIHFILAWQDDEPPQPSAAAPPEQRSDEPLEIDEQLL